MAPRKIRTRSRTRTGARTNPPRNLRRSHQKAQKSLQKAQKNLQKARKNPQKAPKSPRRSHPRPPNPLARSHQCRQAPPLNSPRPCSPRRARKMKTHPSSWSLCTTRRRRRMEVSELSCGDTHLATSGVGVGGLTTAEHHPTSCSAALAAPYSWPGFVPLGFPSVSPHSFP